MSCCLNKGASIETAFTYVCARIRLRGAPLDDVVCLYLSETLRRKTCVGGLDALASVVAPALCMAYTPFWKLSKKDALASCLEAQ